MVPIKEVHKSDQLFSIGLTIRVCILIPQFLIYMPTVHRFADPALQLNETDIESTSVVGLLQL